MHHDQPADMEDKAVSKSESRAGEEVASSEQEQGRVDTGTQGAADRPTGESTARDWTGVDPKEPITRDSPNG
jgi:hypothetical protein